ncbi:hypothetical protein [Tenacibaculum sp. 190524A02b]|uniref:hypothetical protein n=1 Tax=Tenacibaculum vairaonense TaxID=3137860 RepID=UPI0031FB98B9
MKKLSLEALQSRAESVVSIELLEAISGGTENACHDRTPPPEIRTHAADGTAVRKTTRVNDMK